MVSSHPALGFRTDKVCIVRNGLKAYETRIKEARVLFFLTSSFYTSSNDEFGVLVECRYFIKHMLHRGGTLRIPASYGFVKCSMLRKGFKHVSHQRNVPASNFISVQHSQTIHACIRVCNIVRSCRMEFPIGCGSWHFRKRTITNVITTTFRRNNLTI